MRTGPYHKSTDPDLKDRIYQCHKKGMRKCEIKELFGKSHTFISEAIREGEEKEGRA